VNFGDISKINPTDLPDFDLFTYSFPCQDLSVAGQRAGMIKGQTRSGLLYECEKIIEAKRPRFLLLENVKNLVGKKFKTQFEEWLTYLESLGYTNYWQVLNAKDYGIPQNRERVFVVSVLGEHDGYAFPKKQNLNIRLKDVLESQVKEKYYLSEKIQARFRPNENFKNMNSNIVGTTAPSFRTIGQRDLCYHENSIMGTLMATDYKQPKQLVERIGGCFECECKYAIEEPKAYKIRKLTPLEYWRLMGISDEDFYKAKQFNSDSQLYKQAGNGIVVPVLEGIFKELF
jgi:DNA (cytosine-5)-methyltransferase 1